MRANQNKIHADVKIPPPVLALIHIALAFLLTWLVPLPLIVPLILQTAGFLLVVLGFLLGLAALIAFQRARTNNTNRSESRLVTSGIYRFTRNPVYLGFLFMLVGILLNADSYWGIVLAPILVILFNRLVIGPEEAIVLQKFGKEYSSYCARVRRWL